MKKLLLLSLVLWTSWVWSAQTLSQGIVMPEKPNRIETFCGYALGSTLGKSTNTAKSTVASSKETIVLEMKLKKPFRHCNMVRLGYAAANRALFQVELRSKPMRMKAEEAGEELEGIVEVLRQKYGEKQRFTKISSDFYSGNSGLAINGQTFAIRVEKTLVDAKGTLKGPNTRKVEAYTFSITFLDLEVKNAPLKAGERKIDATKGSDVL